MNQRVVESVLVIADGEVREGLERNVRPHHGVQRRPDCIEPRQPQSPFVSKRLECSVAFWGNIALGERIDESVTHFIEAGAPASLI